MFANVRDKNIYLYMVHQMIFSTGIKHLSETSRKSFFYLLAVLLLFSLTACGGKKINEIFLMPAPDVYDTGVIDPFTDFNPIDSIPYEGMLYATDRKPAEEGDEKNIYLNERGFLLRVGVGKLKLGDNTMTWEEARKISLLKNRPGNYPLKITSVEEIGILADSYSQFIPPEVSDIHQPEKDFAAKVNSKLEKSKKKDIFIYVHGYKVVFENPLLVAAELWHFLGYEGVFIAYSWPSTPKTLAYFSDLETTTLSATNLRLLLEYLARDTDAEKIHIIAEEIMRGSKDVAESIHRSLSAPDELRAAVFSTATSYEGIVEASQETVERAGEISDLTEQQRGAARAVTTSLEEISQIARQNAQGTDEASAATDQQTASMQLLARSAAFGS